MKRQESSEIDLKGSLRDFLLPIVEFLGILVPGMFFIFALVPAVIVPSATFVRVVEGAQATAPVASEYLVTLVLSPSGGSIFLLAIFSYVFGHMFFRQDPKVPDQESFKKVNDAPLGEEEGPVRMCPAEIEHNKKFGDSKEKATPDQHNLEFPYRYLYEYLKQRGMMHLAKIIPWRGREPETYQKRTKHFMNVIKMRLEFLYPYQYIRIQRNEAHVRLMSSMWYASKSLIVASAIGTTIGIASVALYVYSTDSTWPIPYVASIVLPVAVLALAIYSKGKVESFLHYQRIREIVFILEAAYVAQQLTPEFDFFGRTS